MYTMFGGKWSNLHNGAMWSVVPVEQGKATVGTSKPMDVNRHIRSFFLSMHVHVYILVHIGSSKHSWAVI